MDRKLIMLAVTGALASGVFAASRKSQGRVRIMVYPTVSRIIVDESELDRNKYFALCDQGTDFRRRCRDDERYEFLVKQGITFGRNLGPVNGVVKWGKAVREDPNRPGFVDIDYLKTRLAENRQAPDPVMLKDFRRLDIAAHGNHNAFPDFMGEHATGQSKNDRKPQALPENIEAAAELSAYVMQYAFNDFNRPAYYEPVNEPHWSFPMDEHIAEWHLATLDKVHEVAPGVKVGGPCSAVAYFYKDEYDAFQGFSKFIDATECRMDFYSFHIYDFLSEEKGDFGGRISTGLPSEGILDLIQNHTVNTFGKPVEIVLSEHGGYEGDLKFTIKLGRKLSGTGFKGEMKRRTIYDFNQVSSSIANTLCFMNHPHIVKKAVPFILLESMGWDPKYQATLYSPYDYEDKSNWIPSRLIDFYRLFQGVEGRYIKIICPDPDIQAVAFASGSKMFIMLNNLSAAPAPISFNMNKAPFIAIRRYGRNDDFTPYFKETSLTSLASLSLKGREAAVIMVDYKVEIPEKTVVVEVPYYGDKTIASTDEDPTFTVKIPLDEPIDHAVLRVGISRPADFGKEVEIQFNGEELRVPLEDCAERLSQEDGDYATTKIVQLDPQMLQATNTVEVSFPDGDFGSIGSVVIRAAHLKQ